MIRNDVVLGTWASLVSVSCTQLDALSHFVPDLSVEAVNRNSFLVTFCVVMAFLTSSNFGSPSLDSAESIFIFTQWKQAAEC